MIALWGMIVCGVGFVGFAAAYFSSVNPSSAILLPATFDFEPRYPWIVPPERRPAYPSYAVAIGVNASQRLNDAQAFVVSFQKWEHDKWSEPLNNFIRTQLAWPAMEKSFFALNLDGKDYLILFLADPVGKNLSLFQDGTFPDIQSLYSSLAPGRYRIEIILTAANLRSGIRQALEVTWPGTIDQLKIALE